jgi:hypothetical protein
MGESTADEARFPNFLWPPKANHCSVVLEMCVTDAFPPRERTNAWKIPLLAERELAVMGQHTLSNRRP